MSTTVRDEVRLKELRAQYQSKHDDASRIVNSPAATPAQLQEAESLFDERDKLAKEIGGLMSAPLRDRKGQGEAWLNQPNRSVPFPGAGGSKSASNFGFAGFEAAGAVDMKFDAAAMHFKAVNDAGPGTVGEKTWELLQTEEYKRDFMVFLKGGKGGVDGARRWVDLCSKTLQEGVDSQGGVLAPAEMSNRIIGRLPAPTRLRSLVNSFPTSRDSFVIPRTQYNADDKYSTAFRATWTGEIPSSESVHAVNDANLFGDLQIPIHTAMISGAFSRNVAEDAAYQLQPWLEGKFGEVIDLLYEDMILNGTGIGQPEGILLGAASGNDGTSPNRPEVVLSGAAAGVTYDSLIDLQMNLAPQYENDDTRWVMNKKSTFKTLHKLKDENLRPLFTTGAQDYGLVARRSRILLDDEVVLSQFMPNIGASSFPIIYGDLKGYYLPQRVGFSIQVLDQTRAKLNQIEIVGRTRFGGMVVEPWRLKIMKSNDS